MVTREDLEILVVRELRKVGFDVGHPRVHRRAELAEPGDGFVLELLVSLGCGDLRRRALVVCRQQQKPIERTVVESAAHRAPEAGADAALLFGAEFEEDAVGAARECGVALLQIVDGRSVFAGSADHYPAWLPAQLVQVVDRDAAGQLRARLLEAGRTEMILEALRR